MPYDETQHDIGLGPVGDTLEGYRIYGGYRSVPQREPAPQEFGGEQDLLAPKAMSRWTQDDFSGGAYQALWGSDPAMFGFSTGIIPSLIERSVQTIAPLIGWAGTTLSITDYDDVVGIFANNASVAIVTADETFFYNFETGAVSSQPTSSKPIRAACHFPGDNFVYGLADEGSGRYRLRRYTPGSAPVDVGPLSPAGAGAPQALVPAGSDFIAILGGNFYLVDITEDGSSATWTRVGRMPGVYRDSTVLDGSTYILLSDWEQHTSVVLWDGTQIAPVCDLPFNFAGRAIEAYGGRLYIGGDGTDVSGVPRYAEFYEVTGGTLRLVVSFGDRWRAGEWIPGGIFDLVVHEGLLFIGTDQGFLHVYDQTRDSLFGGPVIRGEGAGAGHAIQALRLLSTREKLFAFGYDAEGDDLALYRSAGADDDPIDAYVPYLETSTFAPQSYRLKRWSAVKVLSRLGTVELEYSQDDGDTWTALSPTYSLDGRLHYAEADLSALDPSASIKFRVSMPDTDAVPIELVSITCTFLFLDSGLRTWAFTLNGADRFENVDGSTGTQDPDAIHDALWAHWTNRDTLTFRDRDGSDHTVILTDLNEDEPVLGPPLSGSLVGAPEREALWGITLTEI